MAKGLAGEKASTPQSGLGFRVEGLGIGFRV